MSSRKPPRTSSVGANFTTCNKLALEIILKTPSCPTSKVWVFFMESIANIWDSIVCYRRDSRSESTTAKRPRKHRFLQFWIFAGIRFGYTKN